MLVKETFYVTQTESVFIKTAARSVNIVLVSLLWALNNCRLSYSQTIRGLMRISLYLLPFPFHFQVHDNFMYAIQVVHESFINCFIKSS